MRRGVDLDHVDAAWPGRCQGDAGRADAARVGRRALLTVQGAGQDPGARSLAAASRPAEQVGVMHTAAAERLPERLSNVILALDLGECGWPVPAVQGQGRGGEGRSRAIRVVGARTRPPGYVCHDLILAELTLAGAVKDPPHTRQSPRTLAAFRPWGSWRDNAVRGVSRQCSHAGGGPAPDPP